MPLVGFEPTTPALGEPRSIHTELQGHFYSLLSYVVVGIPITTKNPENIGTLGEPRSIHTELRAHIGD